MSLNGISARYRPGVLAVSPREHDQRPDEYTEKARAELRADNEWIAGVVSEAIDGFLAEMLMDADRSESERDRDFTARLRAVVNTKIESEVPSLAESLWQRDIESEQQAAAEYAADSRGDY